FVGILSRGDDEIEAKKWLCSKKVDGRLINGNFAQKINGPEERLLGHHLAFATLGQETIGTLKGATAFARHREQQQLANALPACPIIGLFIHYLHLSSIRHLRLQVTIPSRNISSDVGARVVEAHRAGLHKLHFSDGNKPIFWFIEWTYHLHPWLQILG